MHLNLNAKDIDIEDAQSFASLLFKAYIDLFQSCKLNSVVIQASPIPAYILWGNEGTSLVLKDVIAWTHFFKYTKLKDFCGGHLFLNDKSSALNFECKLLRHTYNAQNWCIFCL